MQNDKKTSKWRKSGVNLYCYLPTGDYYARAKVGGKLREKHLNTSKVTVARVRLAKFLQEEREKVERERNLARGEMTVADAIAKLKSDLDDEVESGQKKASARLYRLERLDALLRTWTDLDKQNISKITKQDCEEWQRRFGAKTKSATSFNNTVSTLTMLLKIGMDNSARYDNPAAAIKKRTPRPKKLNLPSKQEFIELLKQVQVVKFGSVRRCADLIRFLAFGGMRKGEAARVVWQDCDFNRGVIHVKGDPATGTKNWDVRQVPMIPEMRALLERMRAERPNEKLTDRVTQVKECQITLTRACQAAGIARMVHHDLRHLFATLVIECGVDIPTLAKWLGHKDGGALAMSTYGHLRQEHSLLMAKKVSFGTDTLSGEPVEESVNVASGDENATEMLILPQVAPVDESPNRLLGAS